MVPLDDGWSQAGTIAATIHNEFERYTTFKAGKSRVDKGRLNKPGDYIPRIKFSKPKAIRVNQNSIDYFQRMIETQYGYR